MIVTCQRCGVLFRRTNARRMKYCPHCWLVLNEARMQARFARWRASRRESTEGMEGKDAPHP
jgi:predicted  nucleic acid-binding Zn-ribbon protein